MRVLRGTLVERGRCRASAKGDDARLKGRGARHVPFDGSAAGREGRQRRARTSARLAQTDGTRAKGKEGKPTDASCSPASVEYSGSVLTVDPARLGKPTEGQKVDAGEVGRRKRGEEDAGGGSGARGGGDAGDEEVLWVGQREGRLISLCVPERGKEGGEGTDTGSNGTACWN